jgi:hypothetical protein
MNTLNRKVIFINKHQAEILEPPDNAVIISINDSRETESDLMDGWSRVLRYYFIDGTYNEDSLRFAGINYKYIYSAYFDADTAHTMRSDIAECIDKGTSIFVIHCHAGRSRSAAIAKYIHETYGYAVGNDVSQLESLVSFDSQLFDQANPLVYKLLQQPDYYAPVLFDIETTKLNSSEDQPKGLIHRLISILTGNK